MATARGIIIDASKLTLAHCNEIIAALRYSISLAAVWGGSEDEWYLACANGKFQVVNERSCHLQLSE
jgi:hypothetical protein